MSQDWPYFGYSSADNSDLGMPDQLPGSEVAALAFYPTPPADYSIGFTAESPDPKDRDYGIEMIYQRIMRLDKDQVGEVAELWHRIAVDLDALAQQVREEAMQLKYGDGGSAGGSAGWTGEGADAFLARGPGGTLKSLDDWQAAAIANRDGARALARSIGWHQFRMQQLYDEYVDDIQNRQPLLFLASRGVGIDQMTPEEIKHELDQTHEEMEDGTSTSRVAYVMWMLRAVERWSVEAQRRQWLMAQDFWSVINGELASGRSTKYEGPRNAVQGDPTVFFPSPPGVPMPGGGSPALAPPNLTGPGLAAPNANPAFALAARFGTPDLAGTAVGPQGLAPPGVALPGLAPPAAPAPGVLPPVPGGRGGVPAPGPRPGAPPAVTDPTGLMSGLPTDAGAGVLHGPASAAPSSADRASSAAPAAMPGAPPPPPPTIRRPGGAPGAPIGQSGRGGSEDSPTRAPGPPGALGLGDHFGIPPAAPASPVLRGPRAADRQGPGTGPPSVPGGGSGWGAAGTQARDRKRQRERQRERQPGPPSARSRSDVVPPVLNRPQPAEPDNPPPRPPGPAGTASGADLVPPPPATASPVVGRSAPPTPATPPPPRRPPSGVLSGPRPTPAEQPGEVSSRRRTAAQEEQELERRRRQLAEEEAWTVETPGGGVVDGFPARRVTKETEPKPSLGT